MKNNEIRGEVLEIDYKSKNKDNLYSAKIKLLNHYSSSPIDYITARPLSSNDKLLPIPGEVVRILKAPSSNSSGLSAALEWYYSKPINIQNNIHSNAIPDLSTTSGTKRVAGGDPSAYRRSSTGNPTVNNSQQNTLDFPDKGNVGQLQAYEGDFIHEGRWGNSIRFGSTISTGLDKYQLQNQPFLKGKSTPGDPIIIIRNGQKQSTARLKDYINEDINEDKSSIWFTAGQQVKLNVSSRLSPEFSSPSSYFKSQLLFNSDQLVLNSKTDHIIMSAAKDINISTNSYKLSINTFVTDVMNILQTVINGGATTAVGPTGTNPAALALFNTLQSKIRQVD